MNTDHSVFYFRVAIGQGNSRSEKSQRIVNLSGKFGILLKVREI